MNSSMRSTRRKLRARPAEIDDDNDIDDDEIIAETPKKKSQPNCVNTSELESRDHLETKKQIELLRKEYGDGWLHTRGASKLQSVLGKSPAAEFSASPKSREEFIENLLSVHNEPDRTSTPVNGKSAAQPIDDQSVAVSGKPSIAFDPAIHHSTEFNLLGRKFKRPIR